MAPGAQDFGSGCAGLRKMPAKGEGKIEITITITSKSKSRTMERSKPLRVAVAPPSPHAAGRPRGVRGKEPGFSR
jgi:hypothetical protein